MTQTMHAWETVIQYIESIGTDHIFGLPSDDLKVLTALQNSSVRFIMGRDQRNCMFMASGYALASNRLGVCIVGKGPALTNTLTGLLEAQHSGVPLLLIALGTSSEKLGTKAFQEADQLTLVKPLVKWAYRIEHSSRLVWALERAAFLAMNGSRGPVYLELPEQIAEETVTVQHPFQQLVRLNCAPSTHELEMAAEVLREARKPIIVVGGGMKSGIKGVIEPLAARLGAAIFATASGRTAINESHPLFCGIAGLYTDPSIRTIWEEADTVLTLGSRLEETATFEWDTLLEHTPLIQVNVSIEDFSHQYRGMKLLGDGDAAVQAWLSLLAQQADSSWLELISHCKREAFRNREACLHEIKGFPSVHVSEVLDTLQSQLTEPCILVQENGLQDMWSYFYPFYQFEDNSLSIVPSDQTSLGFGAAAAVGASLADHRPVVALVGDGAFNLFQSDLITAIQHHIPLIYIVMNNGGYGWLQYQLNQYNFEGRPFQFVTDAPLEHMNWSHHDFIEMINIQEKSELESQLTLALTRYRMNKLVIVMVKVALEDVHQKIRNIYGDFPVFDNQIM
ncbi:thiamine pyrophosphate-binding protein [Paenibacillus sp. FSL K6-1230]|uniref:thiamine pyrophosphate-binding protein n=1 Tax=Paenibacillus sp. FSL K6-1230 TaxID=2921603 RepID=UPI0030FD1BF5